MTAIRGGSKLLVYLTFIWSGKFNFLNNHVLYEKDIRDPFGALVYCALRVVIGSPKEVQL